MIAVYEHTQIGRVVIFPIAIIACIIIVAAISSPTRAVLIGVAAVLAVVALLMWKLTVRVDDDALRVSFGPGLISKQVPLAEIQSCEPVRTGWSAGWGIHHTRHGRLYNVSIGDAVAIRLRNGQQFCIGTDQPNELIAAIRRFASAR